MRGEHRCTQSNTLGDETDKIMCRRPCAPSRIVIKLLVHAVDVLAFADPRFLSLLSTSTGRVFSAEYPYILEIVILILPHTLVASGASKTGPAWAQLLRCRLAGGTLRYRLHRQQRWKYGA
jgi:hypothetical protein